jgi:hypothetical protein
MYKKAKITTTEEANVGTKMNTERRNETRMYGGQKCEM